MPSSPLENGVGVEDLFDFLWSQIWLETIL